jgi:hypothetical protein
MKAGLSPEQQLTWEIYARDAHAFLFDGDLWTKDEHDPDFPEKPFPDYPYLRCLLDCLLVSGHWLAPHNACYALEWGIPLRHLEQQASTGTLFIEKSRQVLASWLCCAYLLWRAKFHAHQLLIVQSRKEEDAAKFVFQKEAQQARISFMESRLPVWLQEGMMQTMNESRGSQLPMYMRRADNGHLWFPNGSHIWAVPQGGNAIRSNTPSLLFSDEAAFQSEFGLAYQAALPALRGGGQGIFISSAEISDFATLVEAEV